MTTVVSAGVPCLWPGSTIVCVGSGPSLDRRDAELLFCRDARIIAINDAYQMVPWADVLYASDAKWWEWHEDVVDLPRLKFTMQFEAREFRDDVIVLHKSGQEGIEDRPTHLKTGGHGGYQAAQVARHLGARKIVLVGYDLKPGADGRHRFHGDHPDGTKMNYAERVKAYDGLAALMAARGVQIVNATRDSAIRTIPYESLHLALA